MMTSLTDFRQRFVFDELDVRGCIVRLDETSSAIQNTHHYPANLATLLNEFALAAALLRDSIKIEGSLTIQLRTPGAISLIMADCLADRRLRAIAEYANDELESSSRIALNSLGQGAILAITITPEEGERYQSIVPIEFPTLAECLQDYFRRSEQLPSLFSFHSEGDRATGIALHALPQEKIKDQERAGQQFEELQILLNTLTDDEAVALSAAEILTRLFHEHSCRLFDAFPVTFGCECSAQKSLGAIQSLGEQEVTSLLSEREQQGHQAVVIDCHFCFQRYEFSFDQIKQLFR